MNLNNSLSVRVVGCLSKRDSKPLLHFCSNVSSVSDWPGARVSRNVKRMGSGGLMPCPLSKLRD